MGLKFGKPLPVIRLLFFGSVLGLLLAWPSASAKAELEQAQLRDLISGLNGLQERLTYKRTLLNLYHDGRNFSRTPQPHVFPGSENYEEITIAFESSLFGATAEDRAEVDGLLQALRQLNQAIDQVEHALSAADRKRLYRFFQDSLPESPKAGPERNEADRERLRRLFQDLLRESPEEGRVSPPAIKSLTSTKLSKPDNPGISGSLATVYADEDFPSWARGPSAEEKTCPAREEAAIAWAELNLQYDATLERINELRKYFLSQQ